ncbi:right-handed parallel beta-helix repeat-containing protein [Modestobacter altitudinis]|uniref:right-handed parallel beta-helix repeat-containing protein n=1 Tax=Modestobacter altitudinis TaxID=2213158 RepID=UPI001485E74A|nr:right-handed parallel beta-helix repeat-containing protein [Modestobacter altitudinis]
MFAVALLVAGTTMLAVGPAAASGVACGDVVSVDTTLTSDLVDCPDIGLVIGANDITLDLNGHTIDGDGTSPVTCPVQGRVCDVGVDNSAGHDGVTIQGGAIQQFNAGVLVSGGADGNRLRRLTIAQTTSEAILVVDSAHTVIEGNTMTDPGITAVVVLESSDALVTRNAASGSTGYAMFLDADHSVIEHNALDAGEHGFAVGGSGTTVRRNVVSDSGGGIDVNDEASGIRVEENELRRVGDGIIVGVASDTLVRRNVVDAVGGGERGGFGIILDGSVRSTVARNAVHATGNGPAIYVAHLDAASAPRDNHVTHNHATSQHADGILVDPDATGTALSGNVAVNSGDDGIDVDAPGTTLTGNLAAHNHDLGIEAVAGVVDGGGNRAGGNGNPAQCTNISCS